MSMTEVRVRRGGPAAVRGEMLLVPVAEGQLSAALRSLDGRVRGPLARRARAARFGGKAEETLVHHGEAAVALLGLGPVPVGLDAWRRAGARGRQEAERERARRAGAYLGDAAADVAAAFVEGFQLAGYRFVGYLSDPERRPRVQVHATQSSDARPGVPSAVWLVRAAPTDPRTAPGAGAARRGRAPRSRTAKAAGVPQRGAGGGLVVAQAVTGSPVGKTGVTA